YGKRLRRTVDDNLDALLLRVLELPFRGLEEAARLARHHLHTVRPEPQTRAATVHPRVAHADDEDALADLVDVAEGYRFEPGNADMDIGCARLAAGKLELLAAGSARAD